MCMKNKVVNVSQAHVPHTRTLSVIGLQGLAQAIPRTRQQVPATVAWVLRSVRAEPPLAAPHTAPGLHPGVLGSTVARLAPRDFSIGAPGLHPGGLAVLL